MAKIVESLSEELERVKTERDIAVQNFETLAEIHEQTKAELDQVYEVLTRTRFRAAERIRELLQ